jgi:hypothetical protein
MHVLDILHVCFGVVVAVVVVVEEVKQNNRGPETNPEFFERDSGATPSR